MPVEGTNPLRLMATGSPFKGKPNECQTDMRGKLLPKSPLAARPAEARKGANPHPLRCLPRRARQDSNLRPPD